MAVFVEPNPFASRLHVLSAMTQAASDIETSVIMAERSDGTDLSTFYAELPDRCSVERTDAVPMTHAEKAGLRRLLSVLRLAAVKIGRERAAIVVFTAIDDYTPWLWILPIFKALAPRGTRLVFVRYRVGELRIASSEDARTIRNRARGIYVRAVRLLCGATECIFDERAEQHARRVLLPDPWSGPFHQKENSDPSSKPFRIGMVGNQNFRKGFDVAVKAILAFLESHQIETEVVIVGRIEPDLAGAYRDLKEGIAGSQLVHVDTYVSDDELAQHFQQMSVVLLPYSTSFTATSGVLSRAVACGTPVIASDHGLVGHRVKAHDLGAVFKYPSELELAASLADAANGRIILGARAEGFVGSCTLSSFTNRFREVILNEEGRTQTAAAGK